MTKKRFSWKTEKLQHLDDEVIMVVDNANKEWKGHILNIVDKLNELNDERMMYITAIDKRIVELEEENKQLRQSVEYWQKKYEEGTETFTVPPNCDKCDFLGNNGICGYCKFTLNCYDSKEDLIDGEVLQNCPLKPLINKNGQLREMNGQLREINKELGDDLHNCRLNKNIISEKLKLWQDTLTEYDIYTIKDLEESFELDAKTNKEKDEKIKELEVKVLNLELEIKRLEKMMWKIQWRFQQEVGIEKAREHYQEIDKEMEE